MVRVCTDNAIVEMTGLTVNGTNCTTSKSLIDSDNTFKYINTLSSTLESNIKHIMWSNIERDFMEKYWDDLNKKEQVKTNGPIFESIELRDDMLLQANFDKELKDLKDENLDLVF